MGEAEFGFAEYETFNDFFTRRLKKGLRPIESPLDRSVMCSPSDGTIFATGKVDSAHSLIDCVKGHSYRLDEYLFGVIGDEENKFEDWEKLSLKPNNNTDLNRLLQQIKARGNSLYYTGIYLAPTNYHRFHAPCAHNLHFSRHIAGYLYLVRPSYVEKHVETFRQNERVNTFGQWNNDLFLCVSYVGALGVGSIALNHDRGLETN